MAIDTINITKTSVKLQMKDLYLITINLSCEDNSVEVINQNVSERYRPGDNISVIVAKVETQMQVIIDKYVGEQVLFNQTALDTQVNNIQTSLRTNNIP